MMKEFIRTSLLVLVLAGVVGIGSYIASFLDTDEAHGTVAITAGALGQLSAALGYSVSFTSADQTLVAASTVYTMTHGLGAVPVITNAYIRNTTTDCGYAVSDRVYIPFFLNAAVGTGHVFADATSVLYNQNGRFVINHKTTTAPCTVTEANWKLVVQAWR
jgi:hypothetical protein